MSEEGKSQKSASAGPFERTPPTQSDSCAAPAARTGSFGSPEAPAVRHQRQAGEGSAGQAPRPVRQRPAASTEPRPSQLPSRSGPSGGILSGSPAAGPAPASGLSSRGRTPASKRSRAQVRGPGSPATRETRKRSGCERARFLAQEVRVRAEAGK